MTRTVLSGGQVLDSTGSAVKDADVRRGRGWMPDVGGSLDGDEQGGGPEGVGKRVREIIRAGGNVIKVDTSGGVLSPRDSPKHAQFQPDELAALMAEAKAAGLPVMAHAQATDGIKNAVRAGVRSI